MRWASLSGPARWSSRRCRVSCACSRSSARPGPARSVRPPSPARESSSEQRYAQPRRNVGSMAPDLAPADELDSAEATLGVLRQVLRGIGPDDLDKQTPCRKFDVAALSDHLM